MKTPAESAPSPQPATEPPAKSSPRSSPKATTAKAPASAVKPAARARAPARPASKPAAAAAVETAAPAEAPKADKAKKHAPAKPKLVRDSFTLPADDYALFATLKKRALAGKTEVKKSELVRAGLAMLARADDAEFMKAIGLVDRIKTGRPKK
ncbi:MAG: hypothetical protein JSR42_20790 [Proteobacteria bacterium]|nr:hypothetical protein [Pseudomonadota bacterium]MBS0555105.1 hypothetical protein [Pseudomonadota bacterium]